MRLRMLGGDARSVQEVIVNGRQLESVSEFKYLLFAFDELITNGAEFVRKWQMEMQVRAR